MYRRSYLIWPSANSVVVVVVVVVVVFVATRRFEGVNDPIR